VTAVEEVSGMHLSPESARRYTEELTKLYREYVSSEHFEETFDQQHPKPKTLLWAGLLLLPLLPVGLGLIGLYLVKMRKLRRAAELERSIADTGYVILTIPLRIDEQAFDHPPHTASAIVLGTFNPAATPKSLAEIAAKIPDGSTPLKASSATLENASPSPIGPHLDRRRRPVSSDYSGPVTAYLFDLTVHRDDFDALGRLQTSPGESIVIPCIATAGKDGHIRQLPRAVFGPAVVTARLPTTSPESRNAKSSADAGAARLRWLQLGRFATSDGRFLVFDPGHYYPDPNPLDDATTQLLLEGRPGPVQIAIKCLSAEATVRGVAGVRLLFSDATPTSREKVGTVDIESERLAIAPFGDLADNWDVGGPRSQSSIVPSLRRIAHMEVSTRERMSPRARIATDAARVLGDAGFGLDSGKRSYNFSRQLSPEEVEHCNALLTGSGIDRVTAYNTTFGGGSDEQLMRAAGVIEDEGFPVEVFSIQYRFDQPLSDDDIGRANQLLRRAKIPASVSTTLHQTLAELEDQIDRSGVGRLPAKGKPIVMAFPTGWKRGSYPWYRLLDGDTLVGYRCDLIEEG